MLVTAFDIGIKNMAYCTLDSDTKRITAWEVFEVLYDTEDEFPRALHAAMAARDSFDDSGLVLIEKQPKCNPKMRCVEAMLKYHFAACGVPFRSYSAVHKLNHECSGRGNYAARKRLSIQTTRKELADRQQEQRFCELFESTKKKDDLADTYLMCMSYVSAPMAVTEMCQTAAAAAQQQQEKAVPARAPTTKQERTKRYSAANVKYLVRQALLKQGFTKQASTEEEMRAFLESSVLHKRGFVPLTKALLKHYHNSLEEFMRRAAPVLV